MYPKKGAEITSSETYYFSKGNGGFDFAIQIKEPLTVDMNVLTSQVIGSAS